VNSERVKNRCNKLKNKYISETVINTLAKIELKQCTVKLA